MTATTGVVSTTEISQPNRELVDRAVSLRDTLRANAAASDRERRLSEEDIQRMTETELLQVCVPRRYGGWQSNFRTLFDVTIEIAAGNGAAGWVCALLNSSGWMAATSLAQAQDDIWAKDPTARVAAVLQPATDVRRADGGYVVSGKWPYGSGSLHAQWANLGFIAEVDGRPSQLLGLVPMSDLSIEDTWYVAGMRGTGSNTIVGDDIFIPDHRIQGFDDLAMDRYATEHTDEVEYRAPFIALAGLVLAAPQIGLAQAALERTLEKLPNRAVTYTKYERGSEAPTNQLAVAEAATAIDMARLLAHRACRDIDCAAATGELLDHLTRARIRMDTGTTITLCRDAIDKLLSATGAGAFATVNPLQQMWRDSEIASRHALINPEVAKEVYGKALFGLDDQVAPI